MDNFRDILDKNYDDNKDIMAAQNIQMVQAWEGGLYYEAGKFGGMQNQMLYKLP